MMSNQFWVYNCSNYYGSVLIVNRWMLGRFLFCFVSCIEYSEFLVWTDSECWCDEIQMLTYRASWFNGGTYAPWNIVQKQSAFINLRNSYLGFLRWPNWNLLVTFILIGTPSRKPELPQNEITQAVNDHVNTPNTYRVPLFSYTPLFDLMAVVKQTIW